MSDSIRLADHIWKDAESLVDRLEQQSHDGAPPQHFYDNVVSGLLSASSGVACSLWLVDQTEYSILSRGGIAASQFDSSVTDRLNIAKASAAPVANWTQPTQIVALQRIADDVVLGISLRLDQATEGKAAVAISELTEAVLQLTTGVFLRAQFARLRQNSVVQAKRVTFTNQLHAGATLIESFAAVANAIAQATGSDRVCLLRRRRSQFELVTSSTQPGIDRRAQQIRLLEDLVTHSIGSGGSFSFNVGEPIDVNTVLREKLDRYLDSAGSRSIRIESIVNPAKQGEPIAAVVIENFRLENGRGSFVYDDLDESVASAVRIALARDKIAWESIGLGAIALRIRNVSFSRKVIAVAVSIVLATLLLWLVPAELKLTVDGRIAATNQQRIFSPTDATIADVLVENGQQVTRGEPLIQLRSAELDLLQKQLEGDLATTASRLAVIKASRSSGRNAVGGEAVAAADEQVLQTQVTGLTNQLSLLREQQADLTLRSPIDGQIDRWDLKQSLGSRPVVHGEYLVDVVAPRQGWTIQLDIPDAESGYVIKQQAQQACKCTFRLRSSPEAIYESTIDSVAEVAMLNEQGTAVVRATIKVPYNEQSSFRVGATTLAQIHCGRQSLGFVWFRSLVEWTRQQGWF